MNEFLFFNISVYSTAEIIDADDLASPEETSILSKKITGGGIMRLRFFVVASRGRSNCVFYDRFVADAPRNDMRG